MIAALMVLVIAVCAAFIIGHAASTSSAASVSTFNDGFQDSKSDDCAQGFKPACDWLGGKDNA